MFSRLFKPLAMVTSQARLINEYVKAPQARHNSAAYKTAHPSRLFNLTAPIQTIDYWEGTHSSKSFATRDILSFILGNESIANDIYKYKELEVHMSFGQADFGRIALITRLPQLAECARMLKEIPNNCHEHDKYIANVVKIAEKTHGKLIEIGTFSNEEILGVNRLAEKLRKDMLEINASTSSTRHLL